MSPSKLGVLANLALAASAVLLPPTMSADDAGDDRALEGMVIDPFSMAVALECPGCAVASTREGEMKWETGVGNAFKLDFEIGPHGQTLELADGYQLFPPNLNAAAASSFYVTQMDRSFIEPLRLRVTSYDFIFSGAETVSQDGVELLPMELHITSVEGVLVSPPVLTINVLKDAEGRLMIASFDTADEAREVGAKEDCNEWPLLCKWKNIVAERIEKMKGKGKVSGKKPCHKQPHYNPMAHDGWKGKPPHRFHPGRPHPHHRPHSHHMHGQHRMQTFASRALFTILIPIVIGIFAGTMTYLTGMVLGTLIAIVIAKIRGQKYQRIALAEDENVEEQSEKEEYAELPAYEEPPVYENVPEKEGEEK